MTKKAIIFVNGYTFGCKPYKPYWSEHGSQFTDAAQSVIGQAELFFVNGEGPWWSNAAYRQNKAKKWLKQHDEWKKWLLFDELYFVTHSMGAAFAEGLLYNKNVAQICKGIYHFSPVDSLQLYVSPFSKHIQRKQLSIKGDLTFKRKHPFSKIEKHIISGIQFFVCIECDVSIVHALASPKDQKKWDFHYDTKTYAYVWSFFSEHEPNFKGVRIEEKWSDIQHQSK